MLHEAGSPLEQLGRHLFGLRPSLSRLRLPQNTPRRHQCGIDLAQPLLVLAGAFADFA